MREPDAEACQGGTNEYLSFHHCFYQSSLCPNWTCREVVDVLVIRPAVGEVPVGVKTIAFGVLKLARFRRLNNSARNSRFSFSRIFKSFRKDKSQVASPGPDNVSRPRFP